MKEEKEGRKKGKGRKERMEGKRKKGVKNGRKEGGKEGMSFEVITRQGSINSN
jgi:hypothetical protein